MKGLQHQTAPGLPSFQDTFTYSTRCYMKPTTTVHVRWPRHIVPYV